MAFADRAEAHGHPQLPRLEPGLIGVLDGARVAHRRGLGGVLGRHAGAEDQGSGGGQGGAVDPGGDDRSVSDQRCRQVGMTGCERPGDPVGHELHLVLGQRQYSMGDATDP